MSFFNKLLKLAKPAVAMVLVLLVSAGLLTINGQSASAAGSATLGVSITPIYPASGNTRTTVGGDDNILGYRISYTCNTASCENTTIKLPEMPKDPTYEYYSPIVQSGWTAPFVGATMSPDGKTVNLGTLDPGSTGSFVVTYDWRIRATYSAPNPVPGSFFPPGFQIAPEVTIDSDTAVAPVTEVAPAVTWQSNIPNPTLELRGANITETGVDYTYGVRMTSNCLTIQNSTPRGDVNYTCAKDYEVVTKLPAEAEFVSANLDAVYDPVTHTVTWQVDPAPGSAPAIGWAWAGNAGKFRDRSLVVRYDASKFSPTGDPDYCDFTAPVTAEVSLVMNFIGDSPDTVSATRELDHTFSHDVTCVTPFSKARNNGKTVSFYGVNRLNGDAPAIVLPGPQLNDKYYWEVSVGNQANVPGRAVIEEPNLGLDGTRPYKITALDQWNGELPDAVISWTLNTGVTGTSNGVANAPAGTWFTAATVTSGDLAGPNISSTGNAQTVFKARYDFAVAPDAPIGEVRTNTATSRMTYPNYPSLADVDLGARSDDIVFVEPFTRGIFSKTADKDREISEDSGDVYIPDSGSVKKNWWIRLANTSNVSATAVIEETDLGSMPIKVTRVHTWSIYGTTGGQPTITYTLSNGATGTRLLPFTAPAGTHFTSIRVTHDGLQAVNTLETTERYSQIEIGLEYTVDTTQEPTTWTNTATGKLVFGDTGIPDLDFGSDSYTVNVIPTPADEARAVITGSFVGTPVVDGGGNPVPGRDVTFQVRGQSSAVHPDMTFSPQYVFIAPANWSITPGSASFGVDAPAGVQFNYTTLPDGRQAVVATWPDGTDFGRNTTWPIMSVDAQPTFAAAVNSTANATFWAGESTNNWSITNATYTSPVTDTDDVDGDGLTSEGFSSATSATLRVGSADLMNVTKEICKADDTAADGCEWVSDPSAPIEVSTVDTGIKYRITIQNTGNSNISNVVAYDVLPFVGDHGLIAETAATPRGSTFAEVLDSVYDVSPGLTLTYSASNNPPRPEVYPGAPGANGTWDSSPDGKQSIRAALTGTLAPGETASFSYTASVASGAPVDALACNSVALVSNRTLPSEPQAVCATTAEADLAISVPERLPLQAGREGIIPFTVENVSGSASAPGTVTVTIPANFTVTSLTPAGWVCEVAGSTTVPVSGPAELDCAPVNAAGDPVSFQLNVPVALDIPVIPAEAVNSVCITGEVTAGVYDSVSTNNTADSCFRIYDVPESGEIGLTKTDGVTAAQPGDQLTYTISVTNELVAETVTGAVLRDALPSSLEFVSASNGGVHAGGVVTWNLADLAPRGTLSGDGDTLAPANPVQLTVTVRVLRTDATSITNTATITAPDPVFEDEELTGTAQDIDQIRHLSITKTSNASDARAGDTVTFTVTLRNNGGAAFTAANPASFVDDLTAVLDDADYNNDAAATGGVGTFNFASPILSWSGPIAAGGSVAITYSVVLKVGGDGEILNEACVPEALLSAAVTDPCAEVSFEIPTLIVDKTASHTEIPAVGTVLEYTVTVTNPSGVDFTTARPATMTDNLSRVLDDATFNDDADADFGTVSYTAPTISWSGALEAGETATITYSVTYNGTGDLALINDACVPVNLTATGYFSCDRAQVPSALLETEKSANPASGTVLNAGDEVTYTLTIENKGGATATVDTFDTVANVLDDAQMVGTPVASVSTLTIGAVTAGRFSIVGTIAPNSTATVQYTVRVDGHADRTNHSLVNFLGEIPVGATCVATNENCTVHPVAHLSVEKTTDATGEITTGSVVSYTLTLRNDGGYNFTAANPATLVDNLSNVLDDATLQGSPTASSGMVSISGTNLRWAGPLAIGASVEVEYSVVVNNEGNHLLDNTVTAVNPGDDDSTANVVTQLSDVQFNKRADVDFGKTVSTGQTLSYQIAITNQGTADGSVNLYDDMTKLLDDASLVADPVSDNPAITIVRVGKKFHLEGSLAAGETANITYQVKVKAYKKQGDRKIINVVNPASAYINPSDPNGAPINPALNCAETDADSGNCTFNPINRNQLANTGLAGVDLILIGLAGVSLGGALIFIVLAARNRRKMQNA